MRGRSDYVRWVYFTQSRECFEPLQCRGLQSLRVTFPTRRRGNDPVRDENTKFVGIVR